MKAHKIEKYEQFDSIEQKQLRILEQAIHPTKLRKDTILFLINSCKKPSIDVSFIKGQYKFASSLITMKTQSLVSILLYLLFKDNKLSLNFVENKQLKVKKKQKKQVQSKKNYNQTLSNDKLESFFQDKKYDNLFELITERINRHKRSTKQMQINQNQQQSIQYKKQLKKSNKYDIIIEQIRFTLQNVNIVEILSVIKLFLFTLSKISQNFNFLIHKLIFKITKSPQKKKNIQVSQIQDFGRIYWKLITQIKNIQSIQLRIPFVKQFIHTILLNNNEQTKKMLQYQKNEIVNLENIYRLHIEEFYSPQQQLLQISSTLFSPLLKYLPNLKVFNYKADHSLQTIPLMKNSFQLFKQISQNNYLLQSLSFQGFKLDYDEQTQNKIQQKVDNQQQKDKVFYLHQDNKNYNQNLYWLSKMQQNCPYLSFIKIQFLRKDKQDERRLLNRQKQMYDKNIQNQNNIMNLFYKRGMNIQTYFNTIKIMETEGYDYETILGVLDKINPFTPI